TERRKKYKAVDLTQHGPNETKIPASLDERTELDFADQPLSDVIEYLQQRHEINIQLDNKALSDAGVGSDTPITRSIKNITLRSALKLLLSELDLTYVIRNEVLMITSKTEAENMLSTRVYPVGDLVIPVPQAGMGRGMFNVPDDEAGQPASTNRANLFRTVAAKDDLKLSKKSNKAAEGAADAKARAGKAPAARAQAAGKEGGIQLDKPAAEQPAAAGRQQARRRGEKVEPI